ncbi:MAG: hypothetical protein LUC26_06580 [Prevotella sp.]|nr:hypothetical protein [Prevotella sp.]
MAYGDILEEELKNKVGRDWFAAFDTTAIVGKIDFSVALKKEGESKPRSSKAVQEGNLWNQEGDSSKEAIANDEANSTADTEFLLWAEAKQGTHHDICESFVQLILTIGKARTFDSFLPPVFLGAFDAEKIAFIGYDAVMHLFAENDFNWNVAPSNHDTREFRHVMSLVKSTLEANSRLYRYDTDAAELRAFIRNNFRINKKTLTAVSINKNNFTHVYLKWLREVKPSIAIDWDAAKKENIIDADFYLADLLSENNLSIKEKLFVLLKSDKYIYNITRRATGSFQYETIDFNDRQKAHTRFWLRYARPPKREYWDYIVNRRDLLVPQDVRERKGSFFTPARWVELSQEYIARELGEDWQDEYYVWDCAAGTGNLLVGLTNKFNIYASTLDKQDVKVMQELFCKEEEKSPMLENHVFQFDFLNDSFDNLPQSLRDIINDEQTRQKLIIYINPPYAEATTATTVTGTGANKSGVANENKTYIKYKSKIKNAAKELFAQFLIRIYAELNGCVIANFSTLKVLQAPNFKEFRSVFNAKLNKLFLVPADTFDNVKGQFPIGFHIWQTAEKELFNRINADVYNKDGNFDGTKTIICPNEIPSINKWLARYVYKIDKDASCALLDTVGTDFQHSMFVKIVSQNFKIIAHSSGIYINADNLIPCCIYLAVRQCIPATWLNDRDQFLAPNDSWKDDVEFQTDCLAYTLFHGQNRISVVNGPNHWIPFTEEEAGAKERFASRFMSDFLRGKLPRAATPAGLFADAAPAPATPIVFSAEAQAVMDAGRNLWRYYHAQPGANPNAAFYDIRLFFQGTNDKGKMRPDSDDEQYTALIRTLRRALAALAEKIRPKVTEHGFLPA